MVLIRINRGQAAAVLCFVIGRQVKIYSFYMDFCPLLCYNDHNKSGNEG